MEWTWRTGRVRWSVDVGLWVVLVAFAFLAGDPMPEGSRLGASAYEGTTIAVLGVAVLLSRRLALIAAALPCLFAIAVTGGLYSDQLLLSQIVLAYLLGRRASPVRAAVQLLLLVSAIGAAYAIAHWGEDGDAWFTLASNVMAQVVLPWAAGQYTRHYAELREAGWELAERLEHQQDLVAGQVRLRERTRIAADMHDSLGHALSLIALRAGALQVSPAIGEVGHREAAEVREAAEIATEQLHQIIGMLREDDTEPPVLPAGDTVVAIVRRAADSGVSVTLTDQTSGADLPEQVKRAARRVVQEALTNATRHAPGAVVSVIMRIEDEHLLVEIANGPPTRVPGERHQGGYGLVGLHERVRLAGGTLDARPDLDGFTLTAHLPLSPTHASGPSVAAASYAQAAARSRLRRGLVGTLWSPVVMAIVLVMLYLVDTKMR